MSEVKRYGHISYLVEATPSILALYPSMSVYVMASDYDAAIAQLEEAKRLLHTASIRLALWLTPGDDPRKQIIAFLSGDEPPASTESSQAQKACIACDGWGTISTGIDEAPSTNCKKCDGTGKGGEQ
jgi:hypothetical protein